jgi:hypothetical protein
MRRITPYIIFWFIGILFSSISGYYYFFYKTLLKKGETVTGKVVNYYYGSRQRSAPIVSYDVNGQTYQYEHPTATLDAEEEYPLGSDIEILYLPDNPTRASLKKVVQTQELFYIFYGSIIFFLLTPLFIFIYVRLR